ncbi:hypothetical protein NC652_018632 [Populus alba x Populus x berolinensis]|nr:hypothetical protein NC652_018632 [Populus alba x Populus x berolinensis]
MYLIRRQPHTQQENGPSERDAKVCELRAALGPLSGRSLQYCTDSCLRRYLEARNWNVDKAKKMLEETIKWRATFKPEEIRWHEVAHEGVTGKISRANFHDRSGRTVLIMRPGMQTTKCTEDNVRYMVYLLENGILNLADGQEQMSWLLDFTGWSLSTNIPIKTSRDCINVLQNHYPQRLAIAFLYNPPRIFEAFWKTLHSTTKGSSHPALQKIPSHVKWLSPFGFPIINEHIKLLTIGSTLLAVNMFRRKHSQNHQENGLAEQEAKVSELRAALGPLSDRSVKYCTDACLRRYLIARNWNVDKAKKMLEETLKWRATYKPEEIRWHEVAHEGETGKVSRADFHDRSGRTVLIMRPGMQNTTCAEDNVRHLVYLIENGILNLGEGQEQMSWLIDFTGWGLSVKVVKFFLDPITIQKVKFVYPKKEDSFELMKSFFDVDNLPNEFGGKATLTYDHEEFSRLMAQDDVKTAKFWGLDEKPSHIANSHSGAQVAPEPTPLALPAS